MTIDVSVRASTTPEVETVDGATRVGVGLDRHRGDARLVAELARPAVVRDALIVLARVYQSDLRYRASDRADYLAFLLKQGKRATKELWDAQKAFLDEKFGEATQESSPLDPIVTITDDQLALEVLSADESAYARVSFRAGEAYTSSDCVPGTSHLQITDPLVEAFGQLRGYRRTTLSLGAAPESAASRTLRVPERWLRGLSQVQAASTLPATGFELAPVDFYNLLFTLRMRRAKTTPRALRYELVPGERPRMVFEPWDHLLETVGPTYSGERPQIVRTWGRRRLALLSPLLPHLERVRVFPMGPGLPVFYELDLGDCVFSFALSGWTDRGWAGISSFDLLVPSDADPALSEATRAHLKNQPASLTALAAATGRPPSEVRAALLLEIQRGLVLHERLTDRYRYRAVLDGPLDVDRLRYRDDTEEQAHRWLSVPGQVRILKTHDLGRDGFRIEGEVEDRQAKRTYETSFTLDREGRTVDASCTSRQFRRSGLKEGPTAPMIALRLLYARQQKERETARETEAGRKLVRAETRTFVRREGTRSIVHRVSLDERRVVLRWGHLDEVPRMQRLMFGDVDGAREEYFRRLDRYAAEGFIDASSAEGME